MRLQDIVAAELAKTSGEVHTLETGSIRGDEPRYEKGDGWSTVAFARHAAEHGGSFTSVDIDTSTAHKVLEREGLREAVDLREGDSRTVLPQVAEEYGQAKRTLDVVLLDSDNDPELIMGEFLDLRPLLRKGTVILVDDVEPESTGVVKGHLILPYLRAAKYEPEIITREGNGFTTGVLRVEL